MAKPLRFPTVHSAPGFLDRIPSERKEEAGNEKNGSLTCVSQRERKIREGRGGCTYRLPDPSQMQACGEIGNSWKLFVSVMLDGDVFGCVAHDQSIVPDRNLEFLLRTGLQRGAIQFQPSCAGRLGCFWENS